jgi:hypothetical protein
LDAVPNKNEIELDYCTVKYEEPVVSLIFKENADLGANELREMIKIAEKLTGEKPYLLLSDARFHMNISSEGRKVAADKKEAPFLVANAALINNLGLTITANFFSNFNKPHFHFKVFNNEKKALKWLMQFDPRKK